MQEKMLDGIYHIGDIIVKLRNQKGWKSADLVHKTNLTRSLISKLENHGIYSEGVLEAVMNALELNKIRRDILKEHLCYGFKRVQEQERILHAYRFATLEDQKNVQSVALVNNLKNEIYPAYIRDECWFVHAYNKPVLDLFGITDQDLDQSNWLGWNVIATKYHPDSKVLYAHGENAELYFPRALKQYFEKTARYFFTSQMCAIRNRLWVLSEDYREWWDLFTGLQANYKQIQFLHRDIRYDNHWLSFGLRDEDFTVEVDGRRLPYTKVVWEPRDSDATRVAAKLAQQNTGKIYFAANYKVESYNDWVKEKPASRR